MTHPVALKMPNGFGLYDMHGNVSEFVLDWWSDSYPESPQVDPLGPVDPPAEGAYRVMRGGSWVTMAQDARSASRAWWGPQDSDGGYLGFRLARTPF